MRAPVSLLVMMVLASSAFLMEARAEREGNITGTTQVKTLQEIQIEANNRLQGGDKKLLKFLKLRNVRTPIKNNSRDRFLSDEQVGKVGAKLRKIRTKPTRQSFSHSKETTGDKIRRGRKYRGTAARRLFSSQVNGPRAKRDDEESRTDRRKVRGRSIARPRFYGNYKRRTYRARPTGSTKNSTPRYRD